MKRFILLTFGFLGWSFYEMSGGADFEPKTAQMAAVAAPESEPKQVVVADAPTPQAPIQIEKTAKSKPVDTTPPGFGDTAQSENVSRVSLNLTTVDNAARTATAVPVTYVPVNAGSTTTSETTPAIIPSLIVPNDPGTNVAAAGGDIREVAGNRVNVRGGPGTDFGIVTKLGRGDAVEVIQDNGDGWVKMRPLDGGPEGWMADFLLTSS